MSRPLRIEYPGAWYHVMNRGRRKEDIFFDQDDFQLFLEILKDTARMWNLRVAAYCLMSNHYHLLVQTPDGNLGRCLRHLNGVYTQRFNRTHRLDGQLFRGRYKAVLVEDDEHLLQLLRYIHRNPLEAKMAESLEAYPWSSHCAYLPSRKGWEWVFRDKLLAMFSPSPKEAFAGYLHFVDQGNTPEVQHFYSLKNLPSIFGSAGFIDRIRRRFGSSPRSKDVPQSAILSVEFTDIEAAVCRVFCITREQLLTSRRGETNQPRDLAMYLLRRHSRKTLAEIGQCFEIANYSTVSSGIVRAQKALKADKVARKIFEDMEQCLRKSQNET